MDIQAYTGHRALTHLRAIVITPFTPKQDEARLRRARAHNHPKTCRQEAQR